MFMTIVVDELECNGGYYLSFAQLANFSPWATLQNIGKIGYLMKVNP